MPRNARNIPSANARLGPEGTASTGGLNRNYIALNVWWRAAASNLEGRPETAGNGRVWRVLMPQAGGEKIYYVLLLVAINFPSPGATAPKQGRGTPTSRFRPLNLRVSARASALRSRYYGTGRVPVKQNRHRKRVR